MSDSVRIIFGDVFLIPPVPPELVGSIQVLGRAFSYYNVFVLAAGVTVAAVLWLLLDKTWWGRSVRATAADREMAGALGLNVPVIYTSVFVRAAAVAGGCQSSAPQSTGVYNHLCGSSVSESARASTAPRRRS